MLSRYLFTGCIAALLMAALLVPLADAGKGGGKGKPGGGGGPIANPAIACVGTWPSPEGVYASASEGSTFQVTTAAEDAAPTWTPDGSRIAFLRRYSTTTNDADLYTILPDGSGLTLVHDLFSASGHAPDFERGLSWSPDGTKILFYSDTDLRVLDLPTGQVQALGLGDMPRPCFDGSFGPDLDASAPGYQGMIAYSRHISVDDWGDLRVVEVSTATDGTLVPDLATDQTLLMPGNLHKQVGAQWSPDGTQIAFLDGGGTWVVSGRWLKVVGYDAATRTFGTPQLVYEAGGPPGGMRDRPTWSPDGQWLAFQLLDGSKWKDKGVYRIRPDGTDLTKVVTQGEAPNWNPAWTNDID